MGDINPPCTTGDCGDGICQDDEDCESCGLDCGYCVGDTCGDALCQVDEGGRPASTAPLTVGSVQTTAAHLHAPSVATVSVLAARPARAAPWIAETAAHSPAVMDLLSQ